MRRKTLGFIGGMLFGLLAVNGLSISAWADTPPPATYRSGDFQPVARVNPGKPIRLQIVNKSGAPIDYILVTKTNSRRLESGQNAVLTGFSLPAYVNINPIRDRTAIRYQVRVDDKNNTAIVEVFASSSGGQRSLNIDETGGVYIF